MAFKVKTKSKAQKEREYYDLVALRVGNAQNFVGDNLYPARFGLGLEEGKDYEVLAYSDWADTFVPTVVKWRTGEVDDFSDEKKTREIISNLQIARFKEIEE